MSSKNLRAFRTSRRDLGDTPERKLPVTECGCLMIATIPSALIPMVSVLNRESSYQYRNFPIGHKCAAGSSPT